MRVATYYNNKDIRIEDMPIPKIANGELLIRVHASGICGSDVMEWYRIHKVPLILGHEIAGEIVEIGKGVEGLKPGMRVAASHHVPCDECDYCLNGHETVCDTLRKTNFDPGGFCEYLRLPVINTRKGVYPLPGNVSYDEATFIEPLACVLRGQRLAGGAKGKSVLIIGSGISGLLHLLLAKAHGASRVITTDISDYRLNKSKEFGADYTINAKDDVPKLLRKINNGRGADLVILCAGADSAVLQALESLERGGTLLIFSAVGKDARLPLPINDIFWRNEVTLMSSYAGSPKDHIEALRLISDNIINVKQMITHKFPLKDIKSGFKLVEDADKSIKVIIEPQK